MFNMLKNVIGPPPAAIRARLEFMEPAYLGGCRFRLPDRLVSLRLESTRSRAILTLHCASYNLFSTNVILASVAFVYYPDGRQWPSLLINLFTLLGSVLGQLLFGFLADWFGRTRLYGIELVLVIVSTIGVATSSHGYGDLEFLGLFIWWRFVMGVGMFRCVSAGCVVFPAD